MASWTEFESAEPDMAAIGRGLLSRYQMAYLATIRADGSPRLHPVSPFIVAGWLCVATPPESPKGNDQLRDPRCVIHFLPGDDDAEFRIRCHAVPVTAGALRDQIFAEGPHFLKAHDRLFSYDIQEAATAYWVNAGKPGTYPLRRSWRAV